MQKAFSQRARLQRADYGQVIGKSGLLAIRVRVGTSVFDARLADPLSRFDLAIGDWVSITWQGDIAWAVARLASQEVPTSIGGSIHAGASTVVTNTTTTPSTAEIIAGLGLIGGGIGSVTIDAGEGPGIDITDSAVGLGGDTILLLSALGYPVQEAPLTSGGLTTIMSIAGSGMLVQLPPCSLPGDHTLTSGVLLRGAGVQASILTGQITGTDASGLENLSITRVANDATKLIAVLGPDSGSMKIRECDISATQSGAGTGYAISVQAGDVYIYNSRAYGSTSMTDEVT